MKLSKATMELFEHKLKLYREKEKYFYEKCYCDGKYTCTNKPRDYTTYIKYKQIADDLEKLISISKNKQKE